MRLIFLSALLAFCSVLFGQQYLYLQKGNEVPHTRLALKDRVKFKTMESDEWVEGILQQITSESITVGRSTYLLDEISSFRTQNNLVHLLGTAGLAGGTLFTGIFIVNALINNETLLTENQAILGASLVTAGFIVRLLARKTYNKEDSWNWKVIDLDKDFEQ